MKIKQAVWDWNGTLLDDVGICVETINTLLTRHGLPVIGDREQYRGVFDFPVEAYYRRIGFDFSVCSFEVLADEYIELYSRNFADASLFPEAEAVLEALRTNKISQSLLSATRLDRLRGQLENFGISCYFEEILGIGDHLAAGKLALAREWMERSRVMPGETVFIGDTTHDAEVAGAVGASCILIANGHHGADRLRATGAIVAGDITEVPDLIKKL